MLFYFGVRLLCCFFFTKTLDLYFVFFPSPAILWTHCELCLLYMLKTHLRMCIEAIFLMKTLKDMMLRLAWLLVINVLRKKERWVPMV